MKFRKKPVVIEAVQWNGMNREAIKDFCGIMPNEMMPVLIPTLEGSTLASVSDWIIKGVKGEFYACKPDIFRLTYEPESAPTPDLLLRDELKVLILNFEDLTPEEKASASNNGAGKEYATYIKVVHNGKTVLLENDAMEPEDARFYRDLAWVPKIIEQIYKLGVAHCQPIIEAKTRQEIGGWIKMHAYNNPHGLAGYDIMAYEFDEYFKSGKQPGGYK